MASPAPKRLTLAEFLEWDDGTDRRYELLDGVPVLMAAPLEAHGELAAALAAEIRAGVKAPCRVISEAGILIPDRADTLSLPISRSPARRASRGGGWWSSPCSSSRSCRHRPAKSIACAGSPIAGP